MGRSQMPPVPPAGRSRKGPGGSSKPSADTSKHGRTENVGQQGRHGNIQQNVHQKGHQSGGG